MSANLSGRRPNFRVPSAGCPITDHSTSPPHNALTSHILQRKQRKFGVILNPRIFSSIFSSIPGRTQPCGIRISGIFNRSPREFKRAFYRPTGGLQSERLAERPLLASIVFVGFTLIISLPFSDAAYPSPSFAWHDHSSPR